MSILSNWLASREGAAARVSGVSSSRAVALTPVTPIENAADVANGQLSVDGLAALFGASAQTKSGQAVTEETARRVATVYACANLIAGTVGTLPLHVYERKDGKPTGERKRVDHDYWWMFNESANDLDSSSQAMEYVIASKLFCGDGFARLLRPSMGSSRVIGYRPYHPYRVQPYWAGPYDRWYRVTNIDGSVEYVPNADMIHLASPGFDGLCSPSPITYAAREAIGNALAQEEFQARFFTNGSTHDIALKTDKALTAKQLDELRASYLAKYGGGANNRTPLILTGGLGVEKLSISPVDADLLPTRQFTVEEICRIFGVPPFMVGANDKTTSWGSGVEQMGKGFVQYTLRRHVIPAQQEFNRKLWPSRAKYFVEFDVSELVKADFKTRMEGYRIAVGRAGEPGWMKPNEVRSAELMEHVEGGDELNAATKPADNTGNEPPANGNKADAKDTPPAAD